jgi:hypothetical protein
MCQYTFMTLKALCESTLDSSHIYVCLLPAENDLFGEIPSELSLLSNLKYFHLCKFVCMGLKALCESTLESSHIFVCLLPADNDLSGQFPSELNSLSKLEHLLVESNQLIGDLDPLCSNNEGLKRAWADCASGDIQCGYCSRCY